MKNKSKIFWLPLLGFAVALLAVLLAVIAGVGTRFNLWFFRISLNILSYSAMVGIAAALLSLAGMIALLFIKDRRGMSYGIIGLIIGILTFGGPWSFMQIAKKVPPIHDISTDTQNPPLFVAVLPLRVKAVNPPEYGGSNIAALQEKAYPDIKTLTIPFSPDQTFDKALALGKKMGWQIVAAEKQAGRIEAVDSTLWMGFKDDIVIRILPDGSGSRLDIRSESRVGKGDFGKNASRIRKFMAGMRYGMGGM